MVEPTCPLDPEKLGPSERFRELPERIPPEDMILTQETTPPPDPTMGRDLQRDLILRYGAG
jgi:hypothetical protein